MKIAQNYAQVSFLTFVSHYLKLQFNVIFYFIFLYFFIYFFSYYHFFARRHVFIRNTKSPKWRPSKHVLSKVVKKAVLHHKTFQVMFYTTDNRDHCGNISVILNICWLQKYWWQVWFLCGSMRLWDIMYLWTGRATVLSDVL